MSATTGAVRVVVADDHPFYRRGLTRSLRSHGIEVVAEAPNGEAAIQAVRETSPDVVVMDFNMPGVSGLEATRRLLEESPERRVLILTVSADEADLTDAIVTGACGYVLKDRPVQEVVAGILAAAAGGSHFSAQLAMQLLRRLRDPARDALDLPPVALDPAERQLLTGVAQGSSDGEIAARLGVTVGEMRGYAASILGKLRPDERVDIARRASDRRRL